MELARHLLGRGLLRACGAAALLGALLLGASTPAAAQDGLDFFGGLFGGSPQQQPRQRVYPSYPSYPSYPGYDSAPRPRPRQSYGGGAPDSESSPVYRRPRITRRPPPSAPVQKEAVEPPPPAKTNASVFVDVFGDSLGQLLANGLDDALADRQDVAIVHKAKGSTGLVTTDYYDWPKAIDDLLASEDPKRESDKHEAGKREADKTKDVARATDTKGKDVGSKDATKAGGDAKTEDAKDGDKAPKEKIDVAVMMIGSNDRQPITENGKTYAVESDEWSAIYKKRVTQIDEAFRKRGIPLIWVGVPITRDSNFANDMAAFNDIYREAAAKTGAVYVDTWEAFSDDNGAFDTYGPDINGQTVRLRSSDGIHFTKAGGRKLAHFVETHVRRALDGKTPPVELPTADAPPSDTAPAAKKPAAPAVAVVKPEAGPIRNLNEQPTATNGELAGAGPLKSGSILDRVPTTSLAKGEAPAPPKGRVDDFRWTPEPAPAAGAH